MSVFTEIAERQGNPKDGEAVSTEPTTEAGKLLDLLWQHLQRELPEEREPCKV